MYSRNKSAFFLLFRINKVWNFLFQIEIKICGVLWHQCIYVATGASHHFNGNIFFCVIFSKTLRCEFSFLFGSIAAHLFSDNLLQHILAYRTNSIYLNIVLIFATIRRCEKIYKNWALFIYIFRWKVFSVSTVRAQLALSYVRLELKLKHNLVQIYSIYLWFDLC